MSQNNNHDSFEPIASAWMYVFFIFFLLAITTIGYGSYRLLSEPATYANESWEKNKQLATNNSETTTDTATVPTTELPKPETPVETSTVSTDTTTTVPVAATLKDELTAIQSKNIVLKQGDKGPDVATVQKFFNQYYKTTTKVDSDFGASLTTVVKKFQGSQKFPTTGQIGPKTLAAMISFAK